MRRFDWFHLSQKYKWLIGVIHKYRSPEQGIFRRPSPLLCRLYWILNQTPSSPLPSVYVSWMAPYLYPIFGRRQPLLFTLYYLCFPVSTSFSIFDDCHKKLPETGNTRETMMPLYVQTLYNDTYKSSLTTFHTISDKMTNDAAKNENQLYMSYVYYTYV